MYDLNPEPNSFLRNISTRSFVQTGDNVMIGGFVVEGTEPRGRESLFAPLAQSSLNMAFTIHWPTRH